MIIHILSKIKQFQVVLFLYSLLKSYKQKHIEDFKLPLDIFLIGLNP
jgi:hypothetical protein